MKRILFAIVLSTSAHAATFKVDPQDSKVSFDAVGKPGFLKIHGEGARANGELKIDVANAIATSNPPKTMWNVSGTFDVALIDLKTGIDLRDTHMREKYLETGKFPRATLVLDPFTIYGDETLSLPKKSVGEFTGKLTIKGVERPVKGRYETDIDKTAKVKASFEIKLTDFSTIGVPSYLGVTVAEDVTVHAEFVAK